MKTKRQIIEEAIKNNTKVSFLINNFLENDVEIVYYDNDDVKNREFKYKVKNGNIYTTFENNINFK